MSQEQPHYPSDLTGQKQRKQAGKIAAGLFIGALICAVGADLVAQTVVPNLVSNIENNLKGQQNINTITLQDLINAASNRDIPNASLEIYCNNDLYTFRDYGITFDQDIPLRQVDFRGQNYDYTQQNPIAGHITGLQGRLPTTVVINTDTPEGQYYIQQLQQGKKKIDVSRAHFQIVAVISEDPFLSSDKPDPWTQYAILLGFGDPTTGLQIEGVQLSFGSQIGDRRKVNPIEALRTPAVAGGPCPKPRR